MGLLFRKGATTDEKLTRVYEQATTTVNAKLSNLQTYLYVNETVKLNARVSFGVSLNHPRNNNNNNNNNNSTSPGGRGTIFYPTLAV